MYDAEQTEGTVSAAGSVLGGKEGDAWFEDFAYDLLEEIHELVGVGGDVVDVILAELQNRVVVVGSGVLDEEQGRGNR